MSFGDGNLRERVRWLERRLESLQAANAALSGYRDELKSENGELRSLARVLWDGYDCFKCPLHSGECMVRPQEQMDAAKPCEMELRVESLGIEAADA